MTGRPFVPLVAPEAVAAWRSLSEALAAHGPAPCEQSALPEAWFDDGGLLESARSSCRRCPVTVECLEYALANDERFGIWGGRTAQERGR